MGRPGGVMSMSAVYPTLPLVPPIVGRGKK
jgi:hypothetical protein